jgi:type I restriction enzyme M protein
MSELGKALWKIADELRDSMNADDFRDYMLSVEKDLFSM